MNIGHVEGGTNAGWRIVREPARWTHDCHPKAASCYSATTNVAVRVTLSSYSCPVCGTRRPAT